MQVPSLIERCAPCLAGWLCCLPPPSGAADASQPGRGRGALQQRSSVRFPPPSPAADGDDDEEDDEEEHEEL